MKRFLGVILLYIIPILGIMWFIQYQMDTVGKNRASSQIARIKNHIINADVVISGNSRAQCSYNTIIMDSILNVQCYNLGMSGRPFDFQYKFLIEPYLERNCLPKVFIQEVCPHAFFHHWNDPFDYGFLPFINQPEFGYYFEKCSEVSKIDLYLPFKYRGIGLSELWSLYKKWERDTISIYYDGYTPRPDTMHYGMDFLSSMYPIERDSDIVCMFKSFVNQCDSLGIQLVLVISPMHIEHFYNYCDMDGFYAQIDSLRAGSNAIFLDYSHMFGSDTIMMKQSTHMSYMGSCIFSDSIAHKLKELNIMTFPK